MTEYCDLCEKPTVPSYKDDAGTQWYKCEDGHITSTPKNKDGKNQADRAVNTNEPIPLSHINEIENPEYTEKNVTVEAVVSGASTAYFTPTVITATIKETDQGTFNISEPIGKDHPINMALLSVGLEQRASRIKHMMIDKYRKNSGTNVVNIEEGKLRTIYSVRVRPPVGMLISAGNKIVDEKGFEYKYLDLYIASDKPLSFQASSLIKVVGKPVPNPRTHKATLLCSDVEFPESLQNFNFDKLKQLQALFRDKSVEQRLNWILENTELFTRIIGRRNIATATLLISFTPTYVSLYGDVQHGWGLADIIGDSTVGKSETVKKIIQLLKAGMYISAETASIVGLVGTVTQIEKEGWFIDWGFLPLMDRKLLAMDGCHKMTAEQWSATAEAERSGEVSIVKAGKGKTNARTRQIKIYNAIDKEVDGYSTKSMCEFLYPIQALSTVADKTTIARRDIAVFADQRDVTQAQINTKPEKEHDQNITLLAESLKWVWMGTAQVVWKEEALNLLLQKATELYNTFHYDAIPLVSPDIKWKLTRLSVALANLTLSTNEELDKLIVTEEHVNIICKILEEEYTKAGLNILAQEYKNEKLTLEDAKNIFLRVSTQLSNNPVETLAEILRFICISGHTTKDQIKTKFELSDKNQLRPLLAVLQTEKLITVKRGYYPATRLIEAYRITDGFATIATINTPENAPPTPPTPQAKSLQQKLKINLEKKNNNVVDDDVNDNVVDDNVVDDDVVPKEGEGESYSQGVKSGNRVKNQPEQPSISENSAFRDTEKTLLIIEPSHGEPCEYPEEEKSHASESQVELSGKKHYCNIHMALVLKGYNPRLYRVQYGNQPAMPDFADKEFSQ